ncbi:UNKNOWN [Stylonychia lemnae]|uniref:Uncharacterized protein n=1 Tax=Stylonychia lemnae TaxID=5949 RepID=A0A078BEW7_STYLE|nr:UNKNOWN [Stylonychia lemnae]|eukprot:CDW91707.1 UNKNOWN [Stylonychia lemnae]
MVLSHCILIFEDYFKQYMIDQCNLRLQHHTNHLLHFTNSQPAKVLINELSWLITRIFNITANSKVIIVGDINFHIKKLHAIIKIDSNQCIRSCCTAMQLQTYEEITLMFGFQIQKKNKQGQFKQFYQLIKKPAPLKKPGKLIKALSKGTIQVTKRKMQNMKGKGFMKFFMLAIQTKVI